MKYLALFAATAVISTPAYAADAVVYTEPVPMEAVSTFSWTGAYIGANAGYAWGKAQTRLIGMMMASFMTLMTTSKISMALLAAYKRVITGNSTKR